ncbi:MAG: hypothetical protein ABEI75_05150, partial [Halobaculum sp.]
ATAGNADNYGTAQHLVLPNRLTHFVRSALARVARAHHHTATDWVSEGAREERARDEDRSERSERGPQEAGEA